MTPRPSRKTSVELTPTKWRYYHKTMDIVFGLLGVLLLVKFAVTGDEMAGGYGIACLGVAKASQALAILHGSPR